MANVPLMETRPDVAEMLKQGLCPMPTVWAGAFVTCGVPFGAPSAGRCDHGADDYRLMLAYLSAALRGPWSCARCGEQFGTEDAAQRHADACTNPTMQVL